jgi:hypothetical protein
MPGRSASCARVSSAWRAGAFVIMGGYAPHTPTARTGQERNQVGHVQAQIS